MSDEQDPPALSLRPRKKPADDEAAADSTDAQAEKPKLSLKPKTDSASAETPSLSLKPKTTEPAKDSPPAEEPATEPPQPRAKPKLSIKLGDDAKKDPAPTESPTPEPEAAKAPEPAAEAKPRLKPKLSLGADTAAEEPAAEKAPEPAAAPPPPPAAKEANSADGREEPPAVEHSDESNPALDPAVVEALKKAKAEKPKLKLNISKTADTPEKEESPAGAAAPPDFPPPPGKKPSNLPPPVPVVTDENGKSATAPPMPLPAEDDIDDEDDDESEAPARKRLRPEQRPIFKVAVVIIAIVLVGAIGAGGYMVYNMMFGGIADYEAPATPVAAPPATTEPAGPSSVAGQLIDKAQDAVAAHDEVTDAVDAAVEGESADEESPGEETPLVTIVTTPEALTPTEVQPSQAFQDWVSSAVITSVRESDDARAFINSIFVKQGDTVDAQLGITFDSVDADRNLVIFKDVTGAIVGKRY